MSSLFCCLAMHTKPIILRTTLALLSVWLLFSSCQQRYWYRQKINLSFKKKKTEKSVAKKEPKFQGNVYVLFSNQSPDDLIGDYETPALRTAYREFKRLGLAESELENADYMLRIRIYVDSATIGRPLNDMRSSGIRFYKSKAINIAFEFSDLKRKRVVRTFKEDIYFFNQPYRDIGRCVQMIRYAVKALDDDKN